MRPDGCLGDVNFGKWFVLALMLWAGQVQAQTQTNLWPARFSFWSGGMSGGQSVKWNGQALVYEETDNGQVVTNRTIQPTGKQWKEFWTATEKVQLSKWKRFYQNPNIMDGWTWTIEITRGKETVQTMGRNAVPDDQDVTKQSRDSLPNKTFNEFKTALEKLLGFKLW